MLRRARSRPSTPCGRVASRCAENSERRPKTSASKIRRRSQAQTVDAAGMRDLSAAACLCHVMSRGGDYRCIMLASTHDDTGLLDTASPARLSPSARRHHDNEIWHEQDSTDAEMRKTPTRRSTDGTILKLRRPISERVGSPIVLLVLELLAEASARGGAACRCGGGGGEG